MLTREVYPKIFSSLKPNQVTLIVGPRRVGKTYLLNIIKKDLAEKEKIKFVSGEDRIIQEQVSDNVIEKLKQFVEDSTVLIIDEAQKIPGIGLSLKLIVDHIPGIKVIASGSSAFDLLNQTGEPLTGRKQTFYLFPISVREEINNFGITYHQSLIDNSLIFGTYPNLYNLKNEAEKKDYLKELVNSYLLKDILELDNIRNSEKIISLLRLLAFQVGKTVSLSELGNNLDLHKDTVFRYLDLLEKIFVIKKVNGFSRNLRKEISKSSKYYFLDNGIYNTIINNFNPLQLRGDVGVLWENYLFAERFKKLSYYDPHDIFFWRTYEQKEIDTVEEEGGLIKGYEFKYTDKQSKAPQEFLETYPNATYQEVNRLNYLEYLS
ncbi:MAG: ATP-binding protein [bacterium]